MSDFSQENINRNKERYQLDKWGEGYFAINEKGNLTIKPEPEKGEDGPSIDMMEVLDDIYEEGLQLPVVVRFQDILRDKVEELNEAFLNQIKKYKYEGDYFGVFPIKVNQMREVVEEVLDSGSKFNFGLEAGSKGELLSVLAMNENKNALTILNGYKDKDFLKLAMIGRKIDRKMIIVIEKYSELESTIEIAKEMNVLPYVGFRTRLNVGGSGKWKGSSGKNAKFGLTTSEILRGVELLKSEGMLESLKLIHFHIGSQITNIQSIKNAIIEGARFYTGLYKLGASLEYFDVGGGLGVDYDGSSTQTDSSKNYNLESYVSDVVYTIKQICDLEGVPHPNLVSESGRFITAHHSCIITKVMGEVGGSTQDQTDFPGRSSENESVLVKNMQDVLDELKPESIQEAYNDAVFVKREAESAFRLGVLSLFESAKIDHLYYEICSEVKKLVDNTDDEDLNLKVTTEISSQYICNFSVFQSLPDCWAIDQLIPIVPLHRHLEEPNRDCTLVDITCDSDGKIDKFINNGEKAKTIKLHELNAEPYYLGFFLTGAYQDVMGDMHNLFGRLNEVHIYVDDDDPDDFYIEEVIRGSKTKHVLRTMQYNTDILSKVVKKNIDIFVQEKRIQPREGVRLVDFYEKCLDSYTYLD